jgi:glycosyltransferase involved in cell wall biosynthesis
MKIAVFGSELNIIGGGERVELDMVKALDADLIVANYDQNLINHFDKKVNIISLDKQLSQTLPFSTISAIKFFKTVNMGDKYDFFIGEGLSAFALKKHKPGLLYFHTPPRELYDMYYLVTENQKNSIRSFMSKAWCNSYRIMDRRFIKKHINYIACNSHNVRNRIYKIYLKEASVVYPSIDVKAYYCKSPEEYWLSVNRLHHWKRIELQIETFRRLPNRVLKIVGNIERTPYVEKIMASAPNNVEFLGKVSEEELRDLYSRCEGHITTAIDEDFGLTPVEAMASGKPVVAVKEGGYLETVLDGITGKLVSPRVDALVEAVSEISKSPENYRENCTKRAKLFDYSVFKECINMLVKDIYDDYNTKH